MYIIRLVYYDLLLDTILLKIYHPEIIFNKYSYFNIFSEKMKKL